MGESSIALLPPSKAQGTLWKMWRKGCKSWQFAGHSGADTATHSSCSYLHDACTRSSQSNSNMDGGGLFYWPRSMKLLFGIWILSIFTTLLCSQTPPPTSQCHTTATFLPLVSMESSWLIPLKFYSSHLQFMVCFKLIKLPV